jgi:acetyl-CoA carboxylase biotin carboxyl carrier protein
VVPGQQVAVVESMKLLFPVNAEVAGTVVEILHEDGAPVEHGQALLAISPG